LVIDQTHAALLYGDWRQVMTLRTILLALLAVSVLAAQGCPLKVDPPKEYHHEEALWGDLEQGPHWDAYFQPVEPGDAEMRPRLLALIQRTDYIYDNLILTEAHAANIVEKSRSFTHPYQAMVDGLIARLHSREAVDPEAHRILVERVADVLENWGQVEHEYTQINNIVNRLYEEDAIHFHRERIERIRDNHPTYAIQLRMEGILEANDRRRRR